MYLHIGSDIVIRKNEVLGIFDLDNASQSHLTRGYLAAAERAGEVRSAAGDELPKSFVLCAAPGIRQRLWLSQLNSSTLARRAAEPGIETGEETADGARA